MLTLTEKTLDLIQRIASDGDLAIEYPIYRNIALGILVDIDEHSQNQIIGHA